MYIASKRGSFLQEMLLLVLMRPLSLAATVSVTGKLQLHPQ